MSITLKGLQAARMIDPRLGEDLKAIQEAINQLQMNTATPAAQEIPRAVAPQSVSVVAANGIAIAVVTDTLNGAIGIYYFLDYTTDPNFAAANVYTVGPQASRTFRELLGNATYYFRVYAAYFQGPSSSFLYFGSPPTGVAVGGSAPPAPPPSTGSGSGGGSGFGGGGGSRQPSRA